MNRFLFGIELVAAVALALAVHEVARAFVAIRLGDPWARRSGRLSLDLRRGLDRFGTLLLPGLGVLLAVAGVGSIPVFAYAAPLSVDEGRLGTRGTVLVALAGPVADLALAGLAGALVRAVGVTTTVGAGAAVLVWVAASMAVVQCMPIPGLDGARVVRRFLPANAAAAYGNLDQYLPLFLILLFFVFGGTFLGIVGGLVSAVCGVVAGSGIC